MSRLVTSLRVLTVCLVGVAFAATAQSQEVEHGQAGAGHSQGPAHTVQPAPAPPPHASQVPHYGQPTLRAPPPHYYPSHGTAINAPPPAPVIINHPSGRYYYSGGVWYAPRGPSYVVVAAPVGVFVPVLPVYYTTMWVGGAPYYYANDTYYTWSPAQNSYQVVAPPTDDGIPPPEDPDAAPPPPAPAAADGLYVYPQQGQSDQQQATDRYECNQWAAMQTGFDPTRAPTSAPQAPSANPDDYERAMKACLEGRGYSVR